MIENNERKLQSIPIGLDSISFAIYFLNAFDFPKSTTEKFKEKLVDQNHVVVGKQIEFSLVPERTASLAYERWLHNHKKGGTRFTIFLDGKSFVAQDLQNQNMVSGEFSQIYKYFEFFLPLLNIEARTFTLLGKPDLKAGEQIAHIRNTLILDNGTSENVWLEVDKCIYIIFVLLHINSFLGNKGDIHKFVLQNINMSSSNTKDLINHLIEKSAFMYGLDFEQAFEIKKIGNLVISKDCYISFKTLLEIDWSDININAIGSIIQNTRNAKGDFDNFTSTENIHKVINPLFLNSLYERLESATSKQDFLSLREIILKMKIVDPCCGTGNFLIASYESLDDLLKIIDNKLFPSRATYLDISHFFGMENMSLTANIGKASFAFAAYRRTGRKNELDFSHKICIKIGNPLRENWESYVGGFDENVYIVGNVKYAGARKQTADQKKDSAYILGNIKSSGELDYASCWFVLFAKYVASSGAHLAFVSTNSVIQGEQVGILWEILLNEYQLKISFLYKPFKWNNGSKNTTGVTVIIVGLEKQVNKATIYAGLIAKDYAAVGPYFTETLVIVHGKRGSSISHLPQMIKGNMPYDRGFLSNLSPDEKETICTSYPEAERYFKKIVGAQEFINGEIRWCLWVREDEYEIANTIPPLRERFSKVYHLRIENSDTSVQRLALKPYSFREGNETSTLSIVVPSVSSENREYIPMGLVGSDTIVTNLNFVIYDADLWVLGILMSRMHNLWIETVCGRLEMRRRYSNVLGYNTFPIRLLSQKEKTEITDSVKAILIERENHSEMTLGQLYDQLPEGLAKAHTTLDKIVEEIYSKTIFENDKERLDCMLGLYKELTINE
jgi:hypothetical protein